MCERQNAVVGAVEWTEVTVSATSRGVNGWDKENDCQQYPMTARTNGKVMGALQAYVPGTLNANEDDWDDWGSMRKAVVDSAAKSQKMMTFESCMLSPE